MGLLKIHKRDIAILTITLILAGVVYFEPKKQIISVAHPTTEEEEMIITDLPLEAVSAIIIDGSTGKILFKKNESVQRPLASLTKIMTAYTALKMMPISTEVAVDQSSLSVEGDSGFRINERFNLKDIIATALVSSSNDGAEVISRTDTLFSTSTEINRDTFIEHMNSEALRLDLDQTYFINPTGLDNSELVSGGYGSAENVAKLILTATNEFPEVFDITRYGQSKITSIDGFSYTLKNTNTIIDSIPGIVASKTGFTDIAQGNLAIVFDIAPLHPISAVVLGSSEKGRFYDMLTLVEATIEHFGRNLSDSAEKTI